ncbi:MAG: GNAT family N-acetyltransferase [Candidatus Zixiibacteriota bacterium]
MSGSKDKKRKPSKDNPPLKFHPLTPKRWTDLEKLFGERGACGGCWCMWWRLKRSQFERQKGKGNKRALKRIVDSGEIPGILAYAKGEPIAWCSVAPREVYKTLERSRILKRVDDQPIWSVVCFFVAKAYRHKMVSVKLLKAAIEHVSRQGGKLVEGYPTEPKKSQMPDAFAWTGLVSAFSKAGFTEVLRRSETRPIMRYTIKKK